jgi:hypothetical protein
MIEHFNARGHFELLRHKLNKDDLLAIPASRKSARSTNTVYLLSLLEALPVRGGGLREEVHGSQQPAQALQAPHQGGPGAVQGRQAGGPGGAPARLAGPGGQQQQQQQPGPPVSRRRVLLRRHVPARGGVFAITQRSVYTVKTVPVPSWDVNNLIYSITGRVW